MRNLTTWAAISLLVATTVPQPTIAEPGRQAVRQATAALLVPAPKTGRARPLVAVVAAADGAEMTDFTVPYAVLKDAGVADVVSLSTTPGPIQLMRAIRVMPDATTGQFDRDHPTGADVVIVPAQMNPKDAALKAWLLRQAQLGATIVSVCEGARVLANAGLLEDRRAASHWGSLGELQKAYPRTNWVRDRRYIQDGPIISTTGVSASVSISLALVEVMGGRAAAMATAHRIGVDDWSAAHRTDDFALTRFDVLRAVGSLMAVWSHETVEFPVRPGVDELALVLKADAWTRTMRSRVVTTGSGPEILSAHGLRILPDASPRRGSLVVETTNLPPQAQLTATFAQIDGRYGHGAVRLVKMGMEYDEPFKAAHASSPPGAPASIGAQPEVRFANIGDRRLAYRVRGSSGPAIVLISGLGFGMEAFDGVADKLAKSGTVITYDRAGYGRSTPDPDGMDARSAAADLDALLTQSDIPGPYILVGHSLGGLIAEYYAAEHPDKIASLVLADSRPADFAARCARAAVQPCGPTLGMVRTSSQGTRAEVAGLSVTSDQVAALRPAEGVPVLVISRALPRRPSPFETVWSEAQQALSAKYAGSTHVIAPGSSHDVHRIHEHWFVQSVLGSAWHTHQRAHYRDTPAAAPNSW